MLYALSSVNSSIVHAKDITADTVAQKPNGTGPFAGTSGRRASRSRSKANAKYFDGAPKASTLQLRVIPSEASILAGMRAGTFSVGLVSDPSVAKQAGSDSEVQAGQAGLDRRTTR